MRKYPPPRYTKDITNSTGSSVFLLFLVIIFPPFGIIYLLLTGLFENSGSKISASVLIFILIPIITIGSFITLGVKETFQESWYLVLITIAEIIFLIILLLDQTEKTDEQMSKQSETIDNIEKSDKKEIPSSVNTKNPSSDFKKCKNNNDEIPVFITSGGKKYHKDNCRCLKGRNDLIKISTDDAKRKNLTACGMCFKK